MNMTRHNKDKNLDIKFSARRRYLVCTTTLFSVHDAAI